MSRRDSYRTCDACGEVSALVTYSVARARLLCGDCRGELEHGVIPEVISGRVPACISGRASGDDGGPGWDDLVKAIEGGGE